MQSHNTTSFHLFPTPPSSPAFLYSEGALTSHIVHTLFTPQITLFSLLCWPEAHSILWPQFSLWRAYIHFLLWCPGWAHQSTRGLVFLCCRTLHCPTFGAVHFCASFYCTEHCFTISMIPPLTFTLLFHLLFFPILFVVWRFGWATLGGTASLLSPPWCGFPCSGKQ